MADEEPKHEIVSRKDAIANGDKFYFTGRPCKFGHIDQRRLPTNRCKTCEYASTQRWRSENREYVRVRDNAYRKKTSERRGELERARYADNPDKFRKKSRRSYWKDPEKHKTYSKNYHYKAGPEYRKKAQDRTKKWALDNPERAKANSQASRIKRRGIEAIGIHTAEDVKRIIKMQKGKCAYCKVKLGKRYHLDHIVPLARGGSNFARNIQATCAKCNMAKHARDPLFHARILGMLL